MEAQSKALEAAYGSPVKVFSDKASGLNERRKGLTSLLNWVNEHPGTTVCVTAKDRLTRFGFTYLEMLIQDRGGKVVVLDDEATKEPHEALMGDFMALLASFSGRFYRIRGWNQQRRLLADAGDIINEKSGQGV
jgi:IS element ISTsi1 orfA, putative resolvase